MIVVDTNILVARLINDTNTQVSKRLSEIESDWIVPPLWYHEFLSVLSQYIRKVGITVEAAKTLLVNAEELIAGNVRSASTEAIFRCISASTLSSYDCEFVALAQDLNLSLVTLDKQILKSFPSFAVHPDDYVLRFH